MTAVSWRHFLIIALVIAGVIPTINAAAIDRTVIGIEWDRSNSAPDAITYLNADGDTISTPASSFWNNHVIWGNIKRVNLADNGTVMAIHGDPSFSYTGSNGQVMVIVPKFYYKSSLDGSKYRWFISPDNATGYTLHPAFITDSTELDTFLISAFEGVVYDVTASETEVDTITVTAAASASSNLILTFDGNYEKTIAVTNGDTVEQVVDKIIAAGVITDYQGVTWTPSKVDADELTYTAGSSGLKTTLIFSGGSTGVKATVVKTTSGAGGYVKNDAAGVDYTATTGDMLSSVAGYKPTCGWKNSITLPRFRQLAQNRGSGWQLQIFNQVSALELLYLVEYGSYNSQVKIGAGVTGVNDAAAGNTYNNALNTGFTAGVGTNSVDLGNASGATTSVAHYKTTEADADIQPMSYRGIENFWGNIWKWVDGINIKADYMPWVADHDFASDTFAHPYVDTGLVCHSADGYASNIIFGSGLDYGFLASAVGGASNQYLCDYYYRSAGNRSALMGGRWAHGLDAGAFSWNLASAASSVHRGIGARAVFISDADTSALTVANLTANTTITDCTGGVQFTDTTTGSAIPVLWNWSFGDGEYSTDQNPIHVYAHTGTYTVNLTVWNAYGDSSTISQENYITVPLIASFSGTPLTGSTPLTVQFTDASCSVDGVASWQWSFGDSSPNSTQQNPAHTYTTSGCYNVTLTVGNGLTNSTLLREDYVCAGNITPTPTPTPTGTVTPTGTTTPGNVTEGNVTYIQAPDKEYVPFPIWLSIVIVSIAFFIHSIVFIRNADITACLATVFAFVSAWLSNMIGYIDVQVTYVSEEILISPVIQAAHPPWLVYTMLIFAFVSLLNIIAAIYKVYIKPVPWNEIYDRKLPRWRGRK